MIRNRLFFKIYLTVIGSLALVAALLTMMAFLGKFDAGDPFTDRLERFATEMYPAASNRADWQQTTDRLSRSLDADITLYASDGEVLASAGQSLVGKGRHSRNEFYRGHRMFVADLPDGRSLAAVMRIPFDPPRRHAIVLILLIAAATSIAAYPVVRHLTLRLEGLRKGMQDWGNGALHQRIAVTGNDEVAAVARTFNKAADRIEALILSQKNLLANASHELRSPLARLRMAVEIMEHRPDQNLRNEIIDNLAELDELVEEILISSRLESAQKPALTQEIDMLALAAEEAAGHDIDISGESVLIHGNLTLLRRMVRNLIHNALRHGAPPISLVVECQNGVVRFSARDHGPGISPEEQEKIFEPFYRPAGRSEVAGGWGLGLSLVRQIAQLHGGQVSYSQPDDGGALFSVDLPVGKAASEF